jgi:hypothetical protein
MLAGVIPAVAFFGCAEATKTVTVERHVTVETPPPPKKKERDSSRQKAAPAKPKPAFVYCDSNIQVRDDTTTCPFAQNTFWTYWMDGQAVSLRVWSPAAQQTLTTTCESDAALVTCRTNDGGVVKFPQAAVDSYSRSQADAYADGHDLGPDPYAGLGEEPGYVPPDEYEPEYAPPDDYDYTPPDDYDYTPPDDYDYTPPGENIPNYDNGRGYRVQCADGTYSHSGGIQGACSHHGGVAD